MRKLIISIIILFATNCIAQDQLDKLTFEDTQNSSVFQNIKNNTQILQYIAANGSVLAVGDTLIIGIPSGSTTSTVALSASREYGVTNARSKSKSSFSTIIMGRPTGFGNILGAMDGEGPENAGANVQGEMVLIREMKVIHKGSKKKPLEVTILLGEINGRAFGLYKYMSITDYEKAVLAGEIKGLHTPMTREEAIAKLKESKDLLDLGLIDEASYEKIKQELTPIIMNKI